MDKRKEANLHVKTSIINALIDLMKEKNFDAISVDVYKRQGSYCLTIHFSRLKALSAKGKEFRTPIQTDKIIFCPTASPAFIFLLSFKYHHYYMWRKKSYAME